MKIAYGLRDTEYRALTSTDLTTINEESSTFHQWQRMWADISDGMRAPDRIAGAQGW